VRVWSPLYLHKLGVSEEVTMTASSPASTLNGLLGMISATVVAFVLV